MWVRDRPAAPAVTTLASLAAATDGISLGLGPVPVWSRPLDDLDRALATLRMLALGRLQLAVEIPTGPAGGGAERWSPRIDVMATVAQRLHVPLMAEVHDPDSARWASRTVEHLVLRGADPAHVGRVIAAVEQESTTRPAVQVWVDLHTATDSSALRAVVAERLALPSVAGAGVARSMAEQLHPGLVEEVESAYAAGRPTLAAEAVPAEFIRATCLSEAGVALEQRIAAYAAAGVDVLTVTTHAAGAAARDTDLSTFADAALASRPSDPSR